jgi:hypothetical protein
MSKQNEESLNHILQSITAMCRAHSAWVEPDCFTYDDVDTFIHRVLAQHPDLKVRTNDMTYNPYSQHNPDAWRRNRGAWSAKWNTVGTAIPTSEHGYDIVRREDVKEGQEFRYTDTADFEPLNVTNNEWLSAPILRQLVEVRPAQPKTEVVPWHEALGRKVEDGYGWASDRISEVQRETGSSQFSFRLATQHGRFRRLGDTIEVLIEDS